MFVPYQIDYSVQNISKTISVSKKRITFKFGFANRKALDERLVGAQCRGSEHEVVFVWSLSSGKRQVIVDGRDNHFSESGMNGWTSDRAFQHQFVLRVPGCGALRCLLISEPVNNNVPGSRPFDFRVQGVSYFNFCKIYELGTNRMIVREGGRPSYSNDEAPVTPEERRLIAQAKVESLRDFRRQQERAVTGGSGSGGGSQDNKPPRPDTETKPPAPAPVDQETSLILFDDPPPPRQVITAERSNPFFSSSVTLDLGGTDAFQQQNTSQAALPPYSNYTSGSTSLSFSMGSFSNPPGQPQQQQHQQQQISPTGAPPSYSMQTAPGSSWSAASYSMQQQQPTTQATYSAPSPHPMFGASSSTGNQSLALTSYGGSQQSSGLFNPYDQQSQTSFGASSHPLSSFSVTAQPSSSVTSVPTWNAGAPVTPFTPGADSSAPAYANNYSGPPSVTSSFAATTPAYPGASASVTSNYSGSATNTYTSAFDPSPPTAAATTTTTITNEATPGYGYNPTMPPQSNYYFSPQQQQQQQQQQQPPLASPSTVASYGSAPTFAQPPHSRGTTPMQQPPYPQQQQTASPYHQQQQVFAFPQG